MGRISTHILDTSVGKPAEGVKIILEINENDEWVMIGEGFTNADGRINNLISEDTEVKEGSYRITFEIESYFNAQKRESFYPSVNIVFNTKAGEHYHVPLLINPFGYSTYRGS
ncbi:hydroxyisourate hydrolase [soil metagenome]